MCTGFDRTPVVTRGDNDRIDPVHDAFVVGGCPVRVDDRKGMRPQNAFDDLVAIDAVTGQRLGTDARACRGSAPIGQVRQDTQHRPTTTGSLEQRRDGLAHAVDGVGAHCIATIHDDVDDQHRPHRGLVELMHLDGTRATTTVHHAHTLGIGALEQIELALHNGSTGGLDVGDPDELYLANHQGFVVTGSESATGTGHTGGITCTGHNRGLFDNHRDQIIVSIYGEIRGNSEW